MPGQLRKLSGFALTKKFLTRGAGIFALGLLVTLATWLYLHEGFILFGILHLIGVSVMLSPLFFRFGKYNIILGLLCIAGGFFIGTIQGPVWLLPLGIYPASFTSVDYTPLIPWFGAVLLGVGVGEFLYTGGVRRFTAPHLSDRIAGAPCVSRTALASHLSRPPAGYHPAACRGDGDKGTVIFRHFKKIKNLHENLKNFFVFFKNFCNRIPMIDILFSGQFHRNR